MKYIPPSVAKTAFNCPHCHVLTTQHWYELGADSRNKKNEPPNIILRENLDNFPELEDKDIQREIENHYKRCAAGEPFIGWSMNGFSIKPLINVHASICYECSQMSIWLYDRLLFPAVGEAPPANPDMPRDIRRDYDEASAILDHSPRGAAALLRLAVQKLCKELGQKGKDINKDIGALVAAGLDKRVQQALDAVRVIGNESVHPGQIDLRDDRQTAETLFRLVNLVVDKMISEPKQVEEVFNSLPASKLAAIKERDGASKALPPPQPTDDLATPPDDA